ncbi:hypothetical protein [Streptomyces sp. NPDC060194]|uniref:hypothetical protein n=1 Tax=Streptomyces sp. NPDC060194 TaxID=3347069 RepID=UPI00364D8C55
MPRKLKMTDEERRAYSARMRGELEMVMDRAYGAMVASEEFWTGVMRTAATLADRSAVNCVVIAAQLPDATDVRSSGEWRKAGRFPAKGSTSIRIWTPIRRRSEADQAATAAGDGRQQSQPEAAPVDGEREGRRVSGFKAGPVFDVSQTDGEAYEQPAAVPHAAEVVRDLLVDQYREAYGEDPERSGGYDFDRVTAEHAARVLLYGHAWRRIDEEDALIPGQRAAEVASAAHVAALMLGVTPGPADVPQLAGVVAAGKKPPIHESAVRVIEAGRDIARVVLAAAERRGEAVGASPVS